MCGVVCVVKKAFSQESSVEQWCFVAGFVNLQLLSLTMPKGLDLFWDITTLTNSFEKGVAIQVKLGAFGTWI